MEINVTWEPGHRNHNSRSEQLSTLSGILSGRVVTIGFRKSVLESRTVHVLGRWMVVLCLQTSVFRTSWKGQELPQALALEPFCESKMKTKCVIFPVWKKEKVCLHFWISFLLQSPQMSFEIAYQFLMQFDREVESWVTLKFLQICEIWRRGDTLERMRERQ